MTYAAKTSAGKPLIFWEQQALEAKNRKISKKNFNYRGKEQKFTLRSKQKPPLVEDDDIGHMTATNGSQKPTNQKGLSKTQPANGTRGQRQAAHKQSKSSVAAKKGPHNAKANSTGKGKNTDLSGGDVNTVTLTEKQLNTILETIGELTIANKKLGEEKVDASGVHPKSEETTQSDKKQGDEAQTSSPTPEPAPLPPEDDSPRPVASQNEPQQTSEEAPEGGIKPAQAVEADPFPASIIPGLGEKATPTLDSKPPAAPIPRGHLTKAEKKRLQWQQERAELQKITAYNPWGKPGAGAPVKDREGNIMADYNLRKEYLMRQAFDQVNHQNNLDQQGADNAVPTAASRPVQSENVPAPAPAPAPASVLPPGGQPLPAAIRSSFALGAVAPDDTRYAVDKDKEKKQWLEELDRQREEAQRRKQQEKEQKQNPALHDTWADKLGGYQPARVPEQNARHVPKTTMDDMASGVREQQGSAGQSAGRVSSAPTVGVDANQATQPDQASNFLRGQNALIDVATRKELEEKRKRYLEHQEAIRAQVEEKERKKREERERKIQEEQEEERKLQKERDELQKQFALEQQKLKQKEERQRRQVEILKEAMDQAKREAERDKHMKRMRRLQQGGHETARLEASYEAHHPGQSDNATHVEPLHVPGLQLSPEPDGPSLYRHEPYTENRVLTPTAFRQSHNSPVGNQMSPRREFGTQTDEKLAHPISREMSEAGIEYRSNSRDLTKRPVRGDSAKKHTAEPAVTKKKGPVKISARPKWGSQNPQKKKAIKQSERDPFYEQRKARIEAARAHRQKELQMLADKNADRIPKQSSIRNRAHSKSPTKSDPKLSEHIPHPPHAQRSPQNLPAEQTESQTHPQSHRTPVQPIGKEGHHVSSKGLQGGSPTVVTRGDNSSPYTRSSPPQQNGHVHSPPIPAIRHRLANDYNMDAYNYDSQNNKEGSGSRAGMVSNRSRYGDMGPIDPPMLNGDFIPFVRSMNVLDPAMADEPLPMSREPTAMQRGRKGYVSHHQPGSYGSHMENYEDRKILDMAPEHWNKDPIMNPNIVKDHPTARQDRILEQLSSLRRGLMMKQRELEINFNPVDTDGAVVTTLDS